MIDKTLISSAKRFEFSPVGATQEVESLKTFLFYNLVAHRAHLGSVRNPAEQNARICFQLSRTYNHAIAK